MQTSSSQFIRLPGEEARELWLCDDGKTWRRADFDDGRKGGLFAIEALAIDSAPFWVNSPAETKVDLEMMSALHWEALGLTPDRNARNWMHWHAGVDDDRVLTATMALAPEATPDEWITFLPDAFEPSARLRPIPPGDCALWKEIGRIVVAFSRSEHLLHVAVLGSRALDADAARELQDLVSGLVVRGFLTDLKECRVWTGVEEGFSESLSSLLGVKVRMEDMPPPVLPRTPSRLLPVTVAHERELKRQRHHLMRFIAVVSLAVLTFFGAWGGWLGVRSHRVERDAAELKIQEPELHAVREAQLRWNALQAATDPDAYPLEMFHQVVSLLPAEGIQLQDVAYDQERLAVGGVASSVNHALKFKADLESNEALRRYTWSFPQPTIHPDDHRATFRAEGTLNGGTAHEGE